MTILELKKVSKVYKIGNQKITALDNISLKIKQGNFVAVMGVSGSGKSTFLQVASMLGTTSTGEIYLNNKKVTDYDESERAHLRNKEIGFIFQSFNLLAKTPAIEQVALPLVYAEVIEKERKQRSLAMLKKVGLEDRLDNTPAELSGGQQQRVAIARALINNPSIVFADEPTGNLDSKSGKDIEKILLDLNKAGKTIIMVTHDNNLAKIANRKIILKDGKIISDTNK
jgi:putative ABC transport system ATP-binding protein